MSTTKNSGTSSSDNHWTNTTITNYCANSVELLLQRGDNFYLGYLTGPDANVAEAIKNTSGYSFNLLGMANIPNVFDEAMALTIGKNSGMKLYVGMLPVTAQGGPFGKVYKDVGITNTTWHDRGSITKTNENGFSDFKIVVTTQDNVYAALKWTKNSGGQNVSTVSIFELTRSETSWEWNQINDDWNSSLVDIVLDDNEKLCVAYLDSNGNIQTGQWTGEKNWSMWTQLTPSSLNARKGLRLAVINGVPWVAYAETGALTVKKLNNQSWVAPSTEGPSSTAPAYWDFALGSDSIPVVTYCADGTSGAQLYVKRIDSTGAWESLGSASDAANAGAMSLKLDSNNDPFVAYLDMASKSGTAYQINVMKHTPRAVLRSMAVEQLVETTAILEANVSTDIDNITVKFYAGTDEASLTNAGEITIPTQVTRKAVSTNFGVTRDTTYYWQVKIYSGDTLLVSSQIKSFVAGVIDWEGLGTQPVTNNGAWPFEIAVSPAGVPYVAYSDIGVDQQIVVKTPNGATWSRVGGPFSGEPYNSAPLVVTDAAIYVANSEYRQGSTLAVFKYTFASPGDGWQPLTSTGLARSPVNHTPALAIDGDNTLYLACIDADHGGSATVFKLTSSATSWVTVGSAGFTPNEIDVLCLKISPDNTPYLAYRWQCYYVGVWVYDGTEWGSITTGNSRYISYYVHTHATGMMQIADDGSVYIIGRASTPPAGLQVWLYEGSGQWSEFGAQYGNPNDIDKVSLAVSHENSIYVVYRRQSKGFCAEVRRWNGTGEDWEAVGTIPILTTTPANSATLLFGSAEQPFLGFSNQGNQDVIVQQAVPQTS